MDRKKKLAVLLGVFVVSCGVAFGATRYEEHQDAIKNSDEIVLKLDADSVTALSWENETTEVAFHKDGTWKYDEDEEFPVDEDKIEELLSIFQSFGVSFVVEDVGDYGDYGLDDPVCTIEITSGSQTFETSDGESDTLTVTLGDYSTMDSERYVSIGDGNVYLVTTDPLEQYDAELMDLLKDDEVPEIGTAKSISFDGEVSYTIEYDDSDDTKSYQPDDVYFAQTDGGILALDTELVEEYLTTLSDAGLTNCVSYNASDSDLAGYGLDSPDLSIETTYVSDDEENESSAADTFTLQISRDPDEKEKAEASDDDDTEDITAYARVGDSRIVYQLDGSIYEALMKASTDDLRHQKLYYGDFSDVTSVDITLDGETYTIESTGDGDSRTYKYDGEELEIDDFRSALKGLSTSGFTDDAADGKEEIRLILHMDNAAASELEIALYRHNGKKCLATVDGETAAYVSREDVVSLIEAVNAIVL